jgi:hypothetical protein
MNQIPDGSRSLTFWGKLGSLQITFNNQPIPYFAIGNGPHYAIYGGDISAFSGQTAQLLITAPPFGGGMIDNFQFSAQSIPESSILTLLGLGALLGSLNLRQTALRRDSVQKVNVNRSRKAETWQQR